MVMIHPSDKGAVVAEDSFHLRGVPELEPAVNITAVLDRPDAINALVDSCAISPEPRTRFHELEEK